MLIVWETDSSGKEYKEGVTRYAGCVGEYWAMAGGLLLRDYHECNNTNIDALTASVAKGDRRPADRKLEAPGSRRRTCGRCNNYQNSC